DRRPTTHLPVEEEVYDAWRGKSLLVKLAVHCISSISTTPPSFLRVAPKKPEKLRSSPLGQSQYITAPVPARLNFSLDDHTHGFGVEDDLGISLSPLPVNSSLQTAAREAETEARLSTMLDQQAAIRKTLDDVNGLDKSVEGVINDDRLTEAEKKMILQKMLAMAASNGDTKEVRRILEGEAKDFVDVNKPDEDGTSPLIYASCFVGSPCSQLLLET